MGFAGVERRERGCPAMRKDGWAFPDADAVLVYACSPRETLGGGQ